MLRPHLLQQHTIFCCSGPHQPAQRAVHCRSGSRPDLPQWPLTIAAMCAHGTRSAARGRAQRSLSSPDGHRAEEIAGHARVEPPDAALAQYAQQLLGQVARASLVVLDYGLEGVDRVAEARHCEGGRRARERHCARRGHVVLPSASAVRGGGRGGFLGRKGRCGCAERGEGGSARAARRRSRHAPRPRRTAGGCVLRG